MGIASALAVVLASLAGSLPPVAAAAPSQTPSLDPLAARPLTTLKSGPAKQKTVPTPRYDDATVLVRFRESAGEAARERALGRRRLELGRAVRGTRFQVVTTHDQEVEDVARSLRRDPAVADVELNYERRASAAPNDPMYVKAKQGWIDTLRLPLAWDRARATAQDVVAVVDTGADLDHPDLAQQLVAGRDVVHADARPDDDNGHGTAVAGIAAARTDDATGVAGVAWGGAVMPVKVLDHNGSGFDDDIAAGIAWAADHGADVINLSLGSPGQSSALDEAVAYARSRGAVVVAASGNDSAPVPNYPAASPGALAVGATDWSGDLAFFSNHGAWVDLVAPGMRMTVARPADDSVGRWEMLGKGTSFAAPIVAGAALLVKAQNPTWTNAQIEERLRSTALDAGPPGPDASYGRGLVDPVAALGGTPLPPVAPPVADTDSTMERARVIADTDWHLGTLAYEGDEDWFAVDMSGEGRVGATVYPPSSRDGLDGRRMDAVLEIYDSAGRPLAYADGSFEDRPEQIWTYAPAAGRYYIRLTNYAGSRVASSYQITTRTTTERGTRLRFPYYDGLTLPYWGVSSAIGDVTGDGHADVLVTQNEDLFGTAYEHLFVSPGDGDGRLGTPAAYDLGARTKWTSAGGMLDNDEMDVTVGDVDGDGKTDAAAAAGRWIGVLYQRGGRLDPLDAVPGSQGAVQVEIADMDGDGRHDLVGRLLGTTAEGTPAEGIVLFRNTTTGFVREVLVEGRYHSMAIGDVDANGRRDVVVGAGNSVRVHRQRTDGTWAPGEALTGGSTALVVADVTGDGRADVASMSYDVYDTNELWVRAQTSTGGLAAPVRYPAPASVHSMQATRVDGDARLDLVVAHDGAKAGGVFLQNADGTLAPEQRFVLGYASRYKPGAVGVGDLTGDGAAEVTVADYNFGLTVLYQETPEWPRRIWLRNTTPVQGERAVATSAAPTLRFGRALVAASITDTTVRLERADTGTAVAATRTWDAASRTLTVRPAAALSAGASYVLRVAGVRDTAGYAPETPIAIHFTVAGAARDTTAPDTRFAGGPVGGVATQDPQFWGYASEPGTRMQCSLDGGAFADCEPLIQPHVFEGPRTLRLRAVDAAGNVDATPASRSWTGRNDGTYPPNDRPSSPQALSGASGSVVGDNRYANSDHLWDAQEERIPLTGATYGAQDVWYRWTAPHDGFVSFDTAGSSFDTVMGAFDDGRPTRRRAHDDDASASVRTSRVRFYARAGRAYMIGVDGFNDGIYSETGTIALAWSMEAGADTTPPDTLVDHAPEGVVRTRLATLAFRSTEPDSTFECVRPGQPVDDWVPCRSPYLTSPSNGENTVRIRAIDAAGNVDPSPAVRTWEAWVWPPDTHINGLSVPGETTSREVSVTFGSQQPTSGFECRLDRGAWVACTSPHRFTGLAPGPHEADVRAVGPTGYWDTSPSRATWFVLERSDDTTPPETTITGGPSGTIRYTSPAFVFSASEASSFECRLDGAAWSTCRSPREYTGLSQGAHTFDVRATDGAGNVDPSPATRSFTVDSVAPDTSITGGPEGRVNSAAASWTFSSSESGSLFECRLDAGAWEACASPKAYTALPDGDHAFEVRARDAAGNVDATPARREVTVDPSAPDTTPPQTTLAGGPSVFTFSADEAGATFACRLDDGPWSPCSSPHELPPLPAGEHRFAVRATDLAGNTDATPAEVAFVVEATDPDPDPDQPPPAKEEQLPPPLSSTSSTLPESPPASLSEPAAPAPPRPLISTPRLGAKALRPAARGGSLASSGGLLVHFRLAARAAVVARVERYPRCTPGAARRGPCPRPVVLQGSFTVPAAAGANHFRFSGRLGGRRLPRGRYRLRLAATDAAGKTTRVVTPAFAIRTAATRRTARR